MEFSTLNESDLHKTLKVLYAETYEGKTEVEQNGHIYDIVTKKGNIIEIQTRNLSKLLPKIMDTIEKGHNVKIVHPVIIRKTIILRDTDGNIISKRKSPKKGSIYNLFPELTGIYPILLNKHFSLEILEINMIEERIKSPAPVQSKNQKRRFKKDWIKSNKILEEILCTKIFNCKENYINLLPADLPDSFCAKDLKLSLQKDKTLPSSAEKQAHLILWVLKHMNLIQETDVIKRNKYYMICK